MKPKDREQKFTLLSWSTAVLTCLWTCPLGGFVGFWAAGLFFTVLRLFGWGQQGRMDVLGEGMIGALLGIVCGAAVGLRIVRSFPDREQKFTLLSWSTAVLTGLLGGFVGFYLVFFGVMIGDIHFFYLGLFLLMIGALLGFVCGAAVGLRIGRIFRGPNRH